jgi:hypothetical protein
MAFDPSLAIADAQFHSHTGEAAYVRSFDFFGKSAKFDVMVPYSTFSAHALVAGSPNYVRCRDLAIRDFVFR